MLLRWTRPPFCVCSTTCAPVRCTPTTPSPSCGASRSPTSGSRGSTTIAVCARAWPRPSTDRARRPSRCAAIVAELLDGGAGPVLVTRADDAQAERRPRRPTRAGTRHVSTARVAARRPPARAGRARARPAPPTSRWPTSAPRSSPPTASSPSASPTPGVAGVHRLLAGCRRPGRGRRRGRGGRHGGRAGQRRGRAHAAPRWWPCPRASATAPASQGSPRCSPCWRRAPPASRSWASTTGTAPPAPCSGR